jgi:RNA-directed DNA polymerase
MAEFVALSKNGLPLGNLTSQLLVNIYMNEFDQYMKHKIKTKYYIRYADDFVIISEDKKYLENLILIISEFLNQHLKLQLHPDKLYIKTLYSGVDFLGWVNFPHHRVLRIATKKRMFRNLKKNNYKKESVNSYLGMLSHGDGYELSTKILSEEEFLKIL